MLSKLLSWGLYFAFLGVILLTGWQQPLKYRFQSPPKPAPPTLSAVVPTSTPAWMNDNSRWDTVKKAVPKYIPPVTVSPHTSEP
jgi:hypothetical protein